MKVIHSVTYLQLFDTSDVLFVAGILPYETVFCKNKNSFFYNQFFSIGIWWNGYFGYLGTSYSSI